MHIKNEKIKNIIVFILILLFIASSVLIREVSNLDEFWNYNISSNFANGLIPYKDFNTIVTPLLGIIGGIVLSIIGKKIIVIRFLNILINSSIVFMTYKIMQKLDIKKFITYLLLTISTFALAKYAMFDYNNLVELFCLIIVYLEINNKEKTNIKYNIFIGILGGLCIITKQTTGLIISGMIVLYKILQIKKKEDIKTCIKQAGIRALGISIPVVLFIVYLLINNAISDFIDYCIWGIKTFTNKISYIQRLIKKSDLIIKILATIPLSLLILIWPIFKNKDKNALIIFLYGIASLSVLYPISDEYHLMSGVFISVIAIGYLLDKLIKKDVKVIEYFFICFCILFTINQTKDGVLIYMNSNKANDIKHYEQLRLNKGAQERIKRIDNYIEKSEKKVYIIDAAAAYYMIPLDIYNKNYDMFLLGNLGSKGEEGQIENLKKEISQIEVLIRNDKYSGNWQNPKKVINWIKQNMQKKGEIGVYDIYE